MHNFYFIAKQNCGPVMNQAVLTVSLAANVARSRDEINAYPIA